jgi:hypothetical protein
MSTWNNDTIDHSDNSLSISSSRSNFTDLPELRRGTRGPPNDNWPNEWVELTPNEPPDDYGFPDYEILGIYANDSSRHLFMKIWSDFLNPIPSAGSTFDFYFNVSSTVWYRIRLERNGSNWDLLLNYTTVSAGVVPTDSNTWISEEKNLSITTDDFDGYGIGFDYNSFDPDSILFWINKTNLSQGYSSLVKPQNCTMFADSHDLDGSQANQVDRAPDLGKVWYNSTMGIIPEFDDYIVFIPTFVMFVLMVLVKRKRKKKKRSEII